MSLSRRLTATPLVLQRLEFRPVWQLDLGMRECADYCACLRLVVGTQAQKWSQNLTQPLEGGNSLFSCIDPTSILLVEKQNCREFVSLISLYRCYVASLLNGTPADGETGAVVKDGRHFRYHISHLQPR